MWATQMKRALDWDRNNKNGFTSNKKYKEKYEETRKGLNGLISNIESRIDEIREQREASGLKNSD